MIERPPFRFDLLSDGIFEDDADTFVQLCAERQSPPHLKVRGKPRVRVGFNSLLVRTAGRTMVIDPGTGDKPRPDKVSAYRMEWPRKVFGALQELGVPRESVDTVILTHLHWDHAGGATVLERGRAVPAFPNATYYVQARELAAARADVLAGDLSSYMPDDYEPLAAAGCLTLLEGDAPVAPGVSVRWVGGHCPGLQIVLFAAPALAAVYLSDLVPTATQLPLDCVLSYDLNLEELRTAKARILAEAEAARALLFFVHAPRQRAGILTRRDAGTLRLDSMDS
jgi:glyoxylase-like metal-dependent hydrolase (beta-lactamase superfamily II)